ncbi:ParB N-terminal domain-containing protein [Pasteurella skyensis]|uniref:ParB family protein n=1 Tax=Phocoenobacter skyensis TaxID=97481 RepID=UPI0027528749|nr:ParB family protein [Pasteurella skyensis]MDP8189098.1 ParB N-terminal domain-containing protein [Pasteurella skyensis]
MNDKVNKLIGGRSKSDRKRDMLAQLSTPAIQNHSPNYQQVIEPVNNTENIQKKLITVTLDKLKPYDGNPRKTKNPAYEEIKASIKSRGLDHAPNITQCPGDNFYIIADGGNTRLQALKELFQETQDPKFWSIECVFKPWQGEANDINSKLNILIGHLAENDIRGDLSFIEKALGIRDVKALYEEKYKEYFSHRKLSEKLGENGYPISYSILSKMEQCLTYLYPHIPNILFKGFGRPQIEKLLSIYRYAQTSWDKYKDEFTITGDFSEIWMHTLSPYDESPEDFSISDFQDTLIGTLCETLQYKVPYETLKLEISLEERKLQKILEKQPELTQRATESEVRVRELHQLQQEKATQPTKVKTVPDSELQKTATVQDITTTTNDPSFMQNIDKDKDNNNVNNELPTFGSNELSKAINEHFAGFGYTPGINPEITRAEEAVENGLEFTNCGKHPVTNIWKIHPNRRHKMDAFSLALDIAEEVGLDHLIEHVIYEPVDYSYRVLPLDRDVNELSLFIYTLLSSLATDDIENNHHINTLQLSSLLLVGDDTSPAISDLLLVRIFRLIRIVRYIKEQVRLGDQND